MDDLLDPPPTAAERAAAEARIWQATWRVLKRRGVPDDLIPAEIERFWRTDPGFVLPSREELGLEPIRRGTD